MKEGYHLKLKTLLFGKTYAFRDVKDVLAKANEPKSGDRLAGLAAESAQERVAAKADLRRASRGLTSEMIAAVCKLMSDLDLIYAARKIPVTAHCNTTIGLPGTLSCRLQPNHPTDDVDGILASLLEGLSFGAGDAVIGLNPSGDTAESVRRVLTQIGRAHV